MNKKDEKIQKLIDKNWEILKASDDKIAAIIKDYEEQLAEKDAVIHGLAAELAHAQALLGRDSTNTSTPTGQTPPWKDRHIPNSRRNTGKPKGGHLPDTKLQPRAARGLKQFREDLFRLLVTRPILYWDDTVVMADKSRICLRFYGDETAVYYVAHNKKDMDGILADGILEAFTEMTRVMHDHNSINYNSRFVFMNLECNAHLQRNLQKSADETGHKVLLEI